MKTSPLYWIYVIQSEAPRVDRKGIHRPGFYYVGMTTDVFRRLREHNGLYADGRHGNPKGGRYTSGHRPWVLKAIYGNYTNRSEALKAEYALKKRKRGIGRTRWSTDDHPLCRGLGAEDPLVGEINQWLRATGLGH